MKISKGKDHIEQGIGLSAFVSGRRTALYSCEGQNMCCNYIDDFVLLRLILIYLCFCHFKLLYNKCMHTQVSGDTG